jgi:hypothetical protein
VGIYTGLKLEYIRQLLHQCLIEAALMIVIPGAMSAAHWPLDVARLFRRDDGEAFLIIRWGAVQIQSAGTIWLDPIFRGEDATFLLIGYEMPTGGAIGKLIRRGFGRQVEEGRTIEFGGVRRGFHEVEQMTHQVFIFA